jgi:hypothetical protein
MFHKLEVPDMQLIPHYLDESVDSALQPVLSRHPHLR